MSFTDNLDNLVLFERIARFLITTASLQSSLDYGALCRTFSPLATLSSHPGDLKGFK
jgi:hypothetical protein